MPASKPSLPRAKKTQGTPGIGLVRAMNLQAVLEAIVEAGELSRPEAAEITGLSLPTATSLIADLETLGLVGNNGQVSGALGRPATLYSFNARAGYVFAVDLGNRIITAGIADLFGNILLDHSEPQTAQATIRLPLLLNLRAFTWILLNDPVSASTRPLSLRSASEEFGILTTEQSPTPQTYPNLAKVRSILNSSKHSPFQ